MEQFRYCYRFATARREQHACYLLAGLLEEQPSGGLVWSRGAAAVPVVDRVRQMLADGMSPGEIAAEAHVNRSYCYRIQKEMLATGELLKPSGHRRSVSPVSSLERRTGDNTLRLRGQNQETNRRRQETEAPWAPGSCLHPMPGGTAGG